MRNTMYAKAKKSQGFIDLNCDACKFQSLKKFTLFAPKTVSFFMRPSGSLRVLKYPELAFFDSELFSNTWNQLLSQKLKNHLTKTQCKSFGS
jgi:hypothetical protein